MRNPFRRKKVSDNDNGKVNPSDFVASTPSDDPNVPVEDTTGADATTPNSDDPGTSDVNDPVPGHHWDDERGWVPNES